MNAKRMIGSIIAALLIGATSARAVTDEGAARKVPWSCYWWPLQRAEILAPLSKYDQITGSKAAEWFRQNKRPAPAERDWAGNCNGAMAAAVLRPQPEVPRKHGSVVLGIGDQKGLLAECNAGDVANVYGHRYYGRPGDDYQDIYPDVLWHYLKLYIKQQGVPVIVDLEAGVEVWNYAVYAYRIEYAPQGNDGTQLARLGLWAADDAVVPDYLGTKIHYTTYQFTFQLREGAVVAGSGRWVGESFKMHPDFVWYPFVVRPQNPELSYEKVLQLVDGGSTPPANPADVAHADASPANPPPGTVHPQPMLTPPVTPPGSLPGIPPRLPPEVTGEPNVVNPAVPISPVQLVAMVACKTSSFNFHATVDKFDGGQYVVGEPLTIRGVSQSDGYLYVFHIDSMGALRLVCPLPGHNVTVKAQQPFLIGPYTVTGPPGTHCIKAVVARQPLLLSGLSEQAVDGEDKGLFSHGFRWCPSQEEQVRQMLRLYQRQRHGIESRLPERPEEKAVLLPQINPARLIGPFAQNDTLFYVGPGNPER